MRNRGSGLIAAILSVGALLVASAVTWAVLHDAQRVDQYMTIVTRSQRLLADAPGVIRLVVRHAHGMPVRGARVSIQLEPEKGGGQAYVMGEWTTDENGAVQASYRLPDLAEGTYKLRITCKSKLGSEELVREMTVQRAAQLLAATDKPLYQPGQRILVKALARRLPGMKPLTDRGLVFELIDPKGNKVYRERRKTSAYGIASVRIPLADELLLGRYRVRVTRPGKRPDKVERVVTVRRYVLPPFRIDVRMAGERQFALAGRDATLHVRARYLFGKPVAGGQVALKFLAGGIAPQRGKLDARGEALIRCAMPRRVSRGQVQRLPVRVSVTDRARHTEHRTTEIVLARQPVLIDAVPMGGYNYGDGRRKQEVIVSTVRPDGRPVSCAISLLRADGGAVEARTGALGLAKLAVDSNTNWQILATTRDGETAKHTYQPGYWPYGAFLLRADRALHEVGEKLVLELFAPEDAPIFVDLVKDRQTYFTDTVETKDGRGRIEIPLTPELAGVVTVTAYRIGQGNYPHSVSQKILVSQNKALRVRSRLVEVKTGAPPKAGTFLPGRTVRYELALSDDKGKPVVGALSLAVIDKAVLALAEATPGMAAPVAAFERELRRPRSRRDRYDYGYRRPQIHRTLSPTVLGNPALADAEREAAASFLVSRGDTTRFDPQWIQSDLGHKRNVVREKRRRMERFFGPSLVGLGGLLLLLACIAWAPVRMITMRALCIGGGLGLSFWLGMEIAQEMGLWRDVQQLAVFVGVLVGVCAALGGLALRGPEATRGYFGQCVVTLLCIALLIPLVLFLADALNARDAGALGLAVGLWVVCAGGITWASWQRKEFRNGFLMSNVGVVLAVGGLMLLATSGVGGRLAPQASMSLRSGEAMSVEYDAKAPAPLDKTRERVDGGRLKEARVRRRFVETLLWQPELITDAEGKANLTFELADNITSWRTLIEAVDGAGRLGTSEVGFTSFQPFFVRPDLPVEMTCNDELSIPVGLFNYAKQAQTVHLELASAEWFEVIGERKLAVPLKPEQVASRSFRIKVRRFGRHKLKLIARSTSHADAVERTVRVVPDGERLEGSASGRLANLTAAVSWPERTIEGTGRLWLKIYPGVASEAVQGLGGMLRMPYG